MKLASVTRDSAQLIVLLFALAGCASAPPKMATGPAAALEIPAELRSKVEVREFSMATGELADAFIKSRIESFQSLLHPGADPYFGMRVPGPTCEDSKRPPMKTGQGSVSQTTIHVYATEQHVFGACDEKLDRLKTQITWVYCPVEKTLFEAKYFYPANQPWHEEPVAHCR